MLWNGQARSDDGVLCDRTIESHMFEIVARISWGRRSASLLLLQVVAEFKRRVQLLCHLVAISLTKLSHPRRGTNFT
jgi:hypothetical protein